ncbi:MAG: methyltransferase domain-containing protein [Burkholderiales bacterium]|nr:methyltransferase domain-containing protein [Burkholderiales bacterium]
MSWNPDQYLRFAEPRLRPAADLLARISGEPGAIVDLGCGAGNVTRLLAERWPRARLQGVDDSAAMLGQARAALPGVDWQCRSIANWQPDAAPDLIYSNAALHWLPDHARLLPRLASLLAPGGTLALQMPRNFLAPSHTMIADTVRAGPWRTRLEPLLAAPPVAEPAAYYDWLLPQAAALDIWESEYLQVLQGPDAVKEWTKGTWLKQFLDRLEGAERDAFEADYARRLAGAYPRRADGSTLFPFRRLFIVLRRG